MAKFRRPEKERQRLREQALRQFADGMPQATRDKLRVANALQFSDPEARARHSEIGRKVWQNPEYRAHMVEVHTGYKPTPEHIEKAAATHRGKKRPPETGKRIAAARRREWAARSPEEVKRITGHGLPLMLPASRRARPSRLETAVGAVLDALGIEYLANKRLGRYYPDFQIPSRRLLIECDGEYWHTQRAGAAESDARRDAYYAERGWRVVRIPEREILAGAELAVLTRIA